MKKGILAILILIMTISISVFADGSTTFVVEPVEENGIVTVEVKYTNNRLVRGGAFDITYDDTKLSLTETVKGEAVADAVCLINDKAVSGKVRVVWATSTEMPENGTIVSLKFSLIADKFEASYIGCANFGVGNKNGQTLKDVTISIAGVEESTLISSGADSNITLDTTEKSDETLPVDKAESDDNSEEIATFSDVAAEDWFFESVNYAKENGLMSGVSGTEFAPEESVTRAMLVVVLHRLEGTPPPAKSSEFADVAAGEWYTDGIAWAAENGIVNGVDEANFAPDAEITREQIAAILYRFANLKGYDVTVGEDTNILSYSDFAQISEYAVSPIQWAVGSGLVKGKTATTLNPQDNATRAEIAVILHRFIEANTK